MRQRSIVLASVELERIMLINFQVVGTKLFNGLPAEHQAALVEECQKAGRATSEKILASEAKVKVTLKEKGMTIVEDVDKAAFRKAGEKAYEVLGLTEAKKQVYSEIGKN